MTSLNAFVFFLFKGHQKQIKSFLSIQRKSKLGCEAKKTKQNYWKRFACNYNNRACCCMHNLPYLCCERHYTISRNIEVTLTTRPPLRSASLCSCSSCSLFSVFVKFDIFYTNAVFSKYFEHRMRFLSSRLVNEGQTRPQRQPQHRVLLTFDIHLVVALLLVVLVFAWVKIRCVLQFCFSYF